MNEHWTQTYCIIPSCCWIHNPIKASFYNLKAWAELLINIYFNGYKFLQQKEEEEGALNYNANRCMNFTYASTLLINISHHWGGNGVSRVFVLSVICIHLSLLLNSAIWISISRLHLCFRKITEQQKIKMLNKYLSWYKPWKNIPTVRCELPCLENILYHLAWRLTSSWF